MLRCAPLANFAVSVRTGSMTQISAHSGLSLSRKRTKAMRPFLPGAVARATIAANPSATAAAKIADRVIMRRFTGSQHMVGVRNLRLGTPIAPTWPGLAKPGEQAEVVAILVDDRESASAT